MLILPRDALARTFAAVATGDFADVPGTAARRRLLRRAFTIIELIAVILILGILGAEFRCRLQAQSAIARAEAAEIEARRAG